MPFGPPHPCNEARLGTAYKSIKRSTTYKTILKYQYMSQGVLADLGKFVEFN